MCVHSHRFGLGQNPCDSVAAYRMLAIPGGKRSSAPGSPSRSFTESVAFCGKYDRRDDEESARLTGAWRPTARLLTRAAATDADHPQHQQPSQIERIADAVTCSLERVHGRDHHHGHIAFKGIPPASRVINLSGQNS